MFSCCDASTRRGAKCAARRHALKEKSISLWSKAKCDTRSVSSLMVLPGAVLSSCFASNLMSRSLAQGDRSTTVNDARSGSRHLIRLTSRGYPKYKEIEPRVQAAPTTGSGPPAIRPGTMAGFYRPDRPGSRRFESRAAKYDSYFRSPRYRLPEPVCLPKKRTFQQIAIP